MGSHEGTLKVAAGKLGLSYEEYKGRLESGQRWCTTCHAWKSSGEFGRDRHRFTGVAAHCLSCRRVKHPRNRRFIRPSQKVGNQASEAVRQAIKQGFLAPANQRRCSKCGMSADHYHHYLGYAQIHHLDVLPMCVSCHQQEHWE